MKRFMLFLMCVILIFSCVGCVNVEQDTAGDTQTLVQQEIKNNTTSQENETDKGSIATTSETETKSGTVDNVQENETTAQEITETEKSTQTTTSPKDVKETTQLENEVEKKQSEETTEKKEETKVTKTEPTTTHSMTNIEQEIFNAINNERAKLGLPAYKYNGEIYMATDIRVKEAMQKWSHTRPDGRNYYTVINDIGATNVSHCNENLGGCFKSVEQLMEGLMNSATHKANIISTLYTHVTISVAYDTNGNAYVAQMFTKLR